MPRKTDDPSLSPRDHGNVEVENQPRKTVLANVAVLTCNPSTSEPEAEDSEASKMLSPPPPNSCLLTRKDSFDKPLWLTSKLLQICKYS